MCRFGNTGEEENTTAQSVVSVYLVGILNSCEECLASVWIYIHAQIYTNTPSKILLLHPPTDLVRKNVSGYEEWWIGGILLVSVSSCDRVRVVNSCGGYLASVIMHQQTQTYTNRPSTLLLLDILTQSEGLCCVRNSGGKGYTSDQCEFVCTLRGFQTPAGSA